MLLFTLKTRNLLNAAVEQLSDEKPRLLWRAWLRDNPQIRRPGGTITDYEPYPTPEVKAVMLLALQKLEASKRERLDAKTAVSEDEASDLENDLTYITALARDLSGLPVS